MSHSRGASTSVVAGARNHRYQRYSASRSIRSRRTAGVTTTSRPRHGRVPAVVVTPGSARHLRVLLTEGTSLSSRESVWALGLAGHEIEVCDPDPLCLDGEVFLEDRIHFRAIDTGLTTLPIGHPSNNTWRTLPGRISSPSSFRIFVSQDYLSGLRSCGSILGCSICLGMGTGLPCRS